MPVIITVGTSQPGWPPYDIDYAADDYFLHANPVTAETKLINWSTGSSTSSSVGVGVSKSTNATTGSSTGSSVVAGVTFNGDIPELSISANILITEVTDILDIYAGR